MINNKELINIIKNIWSNNYTIDTVRSAAELLYSKFETHGKVPIVDIVNALGFKIYTQDLPENVGGYIAIGDKAIDKTGHDKIIVVNNNSKYNRQRFTLAHELGHYLLDPNARDGAAFYDAFEDDENNSEMELMINRFAAELLIPAPCFVERYKRKSMHKLSKYEQYKDLAEFFSVPITSVERRFNEVDLNINE